MKRMHPGAVLCLSLAISACSREPAAPVASVLDAKDRIEVIGCLTGNPAVNQFVVTANADTMTSLANRAADGKAETFSYVLEGGSNLPEHIGKEVIVKGKIAGDPHVVSMERKEDEVVKATPKTETAAEVALTQEVELKVTPLRVESLNPTGASCK